MDPPSSPHFYRKKSRKCRAASLPSRRVAQSHRCHLEPVLRLFPAIIQTKTSQDTQGCLSLIFSNCAVRQNVTSWRSQQFVGAMECDCSG